MFGCGCQKTIAFLLFSCYNVLCEHTIFLEEALPVARKQEKNTWYPLDRHSGYSILPFQKERYSAVYRFSALID